MTFWEKIKLFGSQIWEYVWPLIQKFLQEGGLVALQMAFIYVPQIAASMGDANGEAKRAEVIRLMLEEAKARGLTLSTSMINAAIEAAVAKLKS